jgi:two-component system osmolarity sensor histidine kinase EnvZ
VRPLLVLEQEVVAFAQGKNPQPLTTSHGTIEIRRLADSIHHMMSDLRSHEQERRTMLAGLPHDIRAPLTRLRLRLALLDDTDIFAFEQDIRAIEHIADQFIGYLRGLDAQSLKTEYFNLNELLGELVLVYQQTGQALHCVLVDEPIFVVADALMLRRADR